ncbi:hypothetical protein Cadr_000012501 [Camelus dromedarius]|uniref:Uncharacterized protein n=1 Tax=Camelus dromedarius TaxID=9838 RepID=A0A5N4D8K7_CAMDR|nr:hypothetical protein Cadr_000012501 [Camelus dromedarius]
MQLLDRGKLMLEWRDDLLELRRPVGREVIHAGPQAPPFLLESSIRRERRLCRAAGRCWRAQMRQSAPRALTAEAPSWLSQSRGPGIWKSPHGLLATHILTQKPWRARRCEAGGLLVQSIVLHSARNSARQRLLLRFIFSSRFNGYSKKFSP